MVRSPFFATVALATLAALAACATTEEPEPQGFLLDYEGFEQVEDGSALVYRRPGFSLGDYDKIILEPVELFCGADSSFDNVDPGDLKRLTDSFEEAILAELADSYKFVQTIGPRVMRLRIAITDVKVKRRPIMDSLDRISKGSSLHLSDVAMEGEILDSRSDERMAAFMDRRISRQSEGRTAFEFWAARLRLRMDEAREIQ